MDSLDAELKTRSDFGYNLTRLLQNVPFFPGKKSSESAVAASELRNETL